MIYNPLLASAGIAWGAAQIIKVLLNLIQDRRLRPERFIGSGGMPSSHSSFTVALAFSAAKYQGVDSAVFAVAVCLALVVMYDAMNVRQETGKQAIILNYMMDHWKSAPELFEKDLKELIGHKPIEVLAGAVLGAIIGLLV